MANYAKAVLIGRLTRDPEERSFASGGKMATFGICVNGRKKNQTTGQWEDEPHFLDLKAFNRGDYSKNADLIMQYLRKGGEAMFECAIQQEKWTDKDSGAGRSKVVFVVEQVQFLGKKADGQQESAAPEPIKPPPPMDGGEDVPF